MAAGTLLVLALTVSLGLGLGLYWLVRAEAKERRVMSRPEAERAARRDSTDDE